MKFRRFITPAVLLVTLLVQFLPGTALTSRPVEAAACDAAEFVADVTIPDGTSFAPGSALVKTWRLRNIGTCTWTTSYSIVFYSGSKMGAPSAVNLPYSVAPGATVDVTVNMTAPLAAGHYRGHWMLRNASSVLFGVGPYGNWTFFIDIIVSGGASSTAYDFVTNYCTATWSSGAGVLPCPGTDGSASGFVLKLDSPKLEDGTFGPAGLLTTPQNLTDGYIQGVFPAFAVASGDRFLSIVNCQYGATGCYVTFQLNYQIDSGPIYTLKSFREKIEGMYYNFNIDLSSLSGQNVKFILKVMASGSPAGDRAVWSGARIVRAGGVLPPPPVSTCDRAAFVADMTIPDGTTMAGGTAFTKTWRLQNVGTCTWTTAYKLVFSGGDYLGVSASAFNLPTSVAPGGTIDLSVNMTAPITGGSYTSYWKLRNATGTTFGVGASGTTAFLVNINVSSSYSSAYNFVSNACSATWSSGWGVLPCPGTDGDARGFVIPLGSHQREDGGTNAEGLLTFPQYVTDGFIQGVYPPFTVQSGDHFQSYVGCPFGGPADCYVIFRLAYQIGAGPVTTLKTASERFENLVYRMDVDLSSLAGQSPKFILMIQAFGSPSGDRAIWSSPRIDRSGGVVVGASTTTITGDNPDSSAPGQTVAVSATVTGAGATPTGTVAITGADTNCNITLVGGSGSCNVVFSTAGAKVLTATYSGDGTYFASSDTESHTVTSGLTASVTTITGDSPDSSTPGQTVAVTATVNGPGVTPTGTVAITGADTNCNITLAGGSGSCNVVFNSAGAKTLTATYGGDATYAGSVDTESHTVSTIVGPNADLGITINDSVSFYTPGGTVTYTMLVNNSGPDAVTGGTVNVTKPSQITSWTVTCVPDAGATCTAGPVSPAGNISDAVNLPVGKKVTYTIVSTISASAVGNMVTTATITNPGPTPDPSMANNTATDTDAPPSAELSITKTDGISMWTPGGTTSYTIVVTNNGPLNVSGATFQDNKPAQITTWTWSCVPDSGATCGAGSGGPVATNISDTVSIPAGKKVTYTIAANLGTAVPGSLVNTATITAPIGNPDPVLSNNTATDTDSGPSADLAVTKTDGVSMYAPNDTLTYTIRVSNNGPQSVMGAKFQDNIPAQILWWSWACVPDFSSACTPAVGPFAGDYIDWILLASGQGVTYTVTAKVRPIATGNLVNSASITAPGAVPDPIPGNNVATDTDAAPFADLSVTKTDAISIYTPGGTTTYTIVVTNNGPSPVIGARVQDTRPTQVTSWIWSCAPDTGAACLVGTSSSNPFDELVDIPVGKKITYTVVASINIAAVGDLVNDVTVTAPFGVPDPIPANNLASDTDAHPSADLSIAITDMVATYTGSGLVIYTITVSNAGPSDAVAATFSDTSPAQVASWTWTCTPDLGAVCMGGVDVPGGAVVNDVVNIPAGKKIIYTVKATIVPVPVGPMTNLVTINPPLIVLDDPNMANNTASDTDTLP